MHIESCVVANRHTARLTGEMTIYNVAELKPQLLALLDDAAQLDIDLSGISEVDTAGIQLLMLTKRQAARANKHVQLIQHSAAVLELIDLYDLAASFGDTIVVSAQQEAKR